MRIFGLLLLSGLGVMAVVHFANRFLMIAHELWAIVAVGLGVGYAWVANFNLWALWNIPVRQPGSV